MANPYHSEFADRATPRQVPDARPAAARPTGSTAPWKMPRKPGMSRKVHKGQGRRVRQMAREDF